MTKAIFSWPDFDKIPIIGIMRNLPLERVGHIATYFSEAGLTNLEVTMNTPGAANIISKLASDFGNCLNVGAGTVCSIDELELALSAGAQFIVSPFVNEKVIRYCVRKNIPVFPGAYTPTEIYCAWSLGASMVKIFPASGLGPGYIRDILAPFSGLKLLPTGGVNLENLPAFFKAGASGVGIGSELFPQRFLNTSNWDELVLHFAKFKAVYENCIKPKKP